MYSAQAESVNWWIKQQSTLIISIINKLMEMMRLQDDDYVATYLRKAKFKMISVPVLGIQEDTG